MLVSSKDSTLNSQCKEVQGFDSEFKSDLEKIISAHLKQGGVGLAAPQIGINKQIAVIGFTPSEEQLKKNPKLISIDQFVIVNPKITWRSKEIIVEKEGCLSIKDEQFDVPRFSKIHLEYQDENGKKHKMKARGYLARIIQHETDHLNGLTIGRFRK